MNAVQRVALLIRADARQTRRIFKQPMHHADFAQRPARGQIVALQRQNLGQHQSKMRFARHAKTAVQSEDIAGFQQQRPQLIITAHEKSHLVVQAFHRAGRQTGKHQSSAFHLDPMGHLRQGFARQRVFNDQPRNGKRAVVFNFNGDFGGFANFKNLAGAMAVRRDFLRPGPRKKTAQP